MARDLNAAGPRQIICSSKSPGVLRFSTSRDGNQPCKEPQAPIPRETCLPQSLCGQSHHLQSKARTCTFKVRLGYMRATKLTSTIGTPAPPPNCASQLSKLASSLFLSRLCWDGSRFCRSLLLTYYYVDWPNQHRLSLILKRSFTSYPENALQKKTSIYHSPANIPCLFL